MFNRKNTGDNKKNIVFGCLFLIVALAAAIGLATIKSNDNKSFTPSGTVGLVDELSIFPTKEAFSQDIFDVDNFIGESDETEMDINKNGEAVDFSDLEGSDESNNAGNSDIDTRTAWGDISYSGGCYRKKGSKKCYTGWVENYNNITNCSSYLKKGKKKTGWVKYVGNLYYLSNTPGWSGCKVKNVALTINRKEYWFDESGRMWKGWIKRSGDCSEDNNMCTYYYGSNGAMKTGWHYIGGKKYYFAKNGVQLSGFRTINNKIYYFDTYLSPSWPGGMRTGLQDVCNHMSFFGGDMVCGYYFGKNGAMKTGWQTINGKKYYFKKSGIRSTSFGLKTGDYGIAVSGWQTINGKKYYFGPYDNTSAADRYLRTSSKKK